MLGTGRVKVRKDGRDGLFTECCQGNFKVNKIMT